MARNDWQDLLGLAGVPGPSRDDVLRQLVDATAIQVAGSSQGDGGRASADNVSVFDAFGNVLEDANKDVSEQMSSLTGQLLSLSGTQASQTSAIQDNTKAVTQNTASKGESSVANQIGGVAESLFGGVFGLSPIISGIMSLFNGGGGDSTTVVTTPFSLPPPVQYQAGLLAAAGGQIAPVSYGQGGQPRPAAVTPTPQVTVQVNAMDSRSFLDHSDEIAGALREALLNSNSVSDVLSEL